ncbi:MAG: EAL domain-containing protein, partial [Blautia sp.]|nr:EAL domain-containing protein [Blautia sp.]
MNNPDHNDDKLARYVTDHIESALAHNEIKVVYEPQVRTASSEVCGFEALARWEDRTYGQLSPKDFVAALEEADKIHILDRGMIRLVCEEYRVRADRGEEMVPISFNLSWKDFILSDMFTWIEQERSRCGVPTSMLRVEITESTIHYDRTAMNEVVDRFADAGYHVWMDDFGSGYSSLNVLKDLRFESLKIDMDFLRDMGPRSMVIIASIVNMAKRLGLHTISEGVEHEEQYDFLREI